MQQHRIFKEGYFHIFNKSISNYRIFSKEYLKNRLLMCFNYYNQDKIKYCLSLYLRKHKVPLDILLLKNNALVQFIGYCIMPDHYHLLLKILRNKLLSHFISNVENSYSRYFNILNNRKGPLWQNRFKSVQIKSNEQLLHVLRYVHLNPTTSSLVNKPEDWPHSSYKQYINNPKLLLNTKEISINNISSFVSFHENQIDYQRILKINRKLYLE